MTLERCIALALCAAALSTAAAAQQARAPRAAAPAAAPATTAAPAEAGTPAASSPEAAEKETAGQMAAQGWLTFLDRRDWGTAWETSAAVFRNAVPLGSWMEGIPKTREPLGALEDRAVVAAVHKTQLQGRPDGDYVTVVFASKFANKEVEEIITTVLEPDGRWRVTGYSTR